MSKLEKDKETEELILSTVKNLFFKEGKFGATTQEIADKAGVNRTLINYYFRSRDNLFQQIFKDALEREDEFRNQLITSDLPFREKIENYIDASIQKALDYPYLEAYIVSCINDGSYYQLERDWDSLLYHFNKDFSEEIEKGNIEKMEPIQFILNMASLTSFPLSMRPLIQSAMNFSTEEYDRIIANRKKIIMKILFKN
ncbi:MAG: TetR/AcrR family transcriptional regulator [Weeksellaceae bacterium]|jgi:AcrR family transcriptional regulator|nr:TetR/AcrR family transcriptional regulator [Weeksellaceae bacterium]MDX9704457.1 TetR/AcrR family transcriptional regulator [Weeksellaceae bacterium]